MCSIICRVRSNAEFVKKRRFVAALGAACFSQPVKTQIIRIYNLSVDECWHTLNWNIWSYCQCTKKVLLICEQSKDILAQHQPWPPSHHWPRWKVKAVSSYIYQTCSHVGVHLGTMASVFTFLLSPCLVPNNSSVDEIGEFELGWCC